MIFSNRFQVCVSIQNGNLDGKPEFWLAPKAVGQQWHSNGAWNHL